MVVMLTVYLDNGSGVNSIPGQEMLTVYLDKRCRWSHSDVMLWWCWINPIRPPRFHRQISRYVFLPTKYSTKTIRLCSYVSPALYTVFCNYQVPRTGGSSLTTELSSGWSHAVQGPKIQNSASRNFVPRPVKYTCQVSSVSAQQSQNLEFQNY